MTFDGPAADIDPREVLRAAGWPAPRALEVVEGGWDNYIWRFETGDGRAHALRLYRQDEDDRTAAAAIEQSALSAAAAAGLPVPAI